MVFILDKMDMTKLIEEFRHFQRERHQRKKTKLKRKMTSFTVWFYERKGANEIIHDQQENVNVRVYEDHILFVVENRIILALLGFDILTYDDGEPDSDDENGILSETVTLVIYQEAQNLRLVFGDLTEKRSFIEALRNLQ